MLTGASPTPSPRARTPHGHHSSASPPPLRPHAHRHACHPHRDPAGRPRPPLLSACSAAAGCCAAACSTCCLPAAVPAPPSPAAPATALDARHRLIRTPPLLAHRLLAPSGARAWPPPASPSTRSPPASLVVVPGLAPSTTTRPPPTGWRSGYRRPRHGLRPGPALFGLGHGHHARKPTRLPYGPMTGGPRLQNVSKKRIKNNNDKKNK